MRILRRIAAWAVVVVALGVFLLFALPSYPPGEGPICGKTTGDFPLEITRKPRHLPQLQVNVVNLGAVGDEVPRRFRKISARPRHSLPDLPRSVHQGQSLTHRTVLRHLDVPGNLRHRPPR